MTENRTATSIKIPKGGEGDWLAFKELCREAGTPISEALWRLIRAAVESGVSSIAIEAESNLNTLQFVDLESRVRAIETKLEKEPVGEIQSAWDSLSDSDRAEVRKLLDRPKVPASVYPQLQAILSILIDRNSIYQLKKLI
jgi:hypothetical protein